MGLFRGLPDCMTAEETREVTLEENPSVHWKNPYSIVVHLQNIEEQKELLPYWLFKGEKVITDGTVIKE